MIQLLIRTFIRDADNTTSRTVRTAYGNLACLVSVVCNLLLFAGKTAVGTLFGSVSITADGLNNLSDASSNIVSLIGFNNRYLDFFPLLLKLFLTTALRCL